MPITDNLLVRVAPETGDADIIDIQSGGTLSGSATTKTLVDIAGEKAWNLAGADLAISFSSQTVEKWTEGTGVTFAFRYRINTYGSNAYSKFLGILTTTGTEIFNITKNNSSNGLRTQWNVTTQVGSIGGGTTSTIHTLVCVVSPNDAGGSNERIHTWINQASRPNNDADYPSSVSFTDSADRAVDRVYFKTPDTMDIDLLDVAVWSRELTDAEAAAVADDLRNELPVSSGTSVTGTTAGIDVTALAGSVKTDTNIGGSSAGIDIAALAGTVDAGNINVSGTLAAIDVSTFAGSVKTDINVSGSTANVDVTAFAGVVTVGNDITVNGTTASINLSAFSGVVSAPGSITTEALKNNTGTVLSSTGSIEVNVYSLTDGSLVVRKTGLTSDGSGIVTFYDASLVAGTTYRVTVTISSSDGIARIQAA